MAIYVSELNLRIVQPNPKLRKLDLLFLKHLLEPDTDWKWTSKLRFVKTEVDFREEGILGWEHMIPPKYLIGLDESSLNKE